jgi:hypothetical protein
MITLAGQVVTVTGGTGFANANIHKTIRADLIKQTGLALAHTINTQGLPPYVFRKYGADRLASCPRMRYETDPPEDLKVSADAADAFGRGVKSANEALKPYGKQLDIEVMASRHSLPLTAITKPKDLQIPETEAAKVVRVDEAREAQGLEPIGDDRLLQELTDAAKTEAAEVNADAKTDVAKMKPAPAPGGPPQAHSRLRAAARLRAGGEFNEADHPRSDDGKFGSGGGGGSKDSSDDRDERPTDEDVHEYVSEAVEARNKQSELTEAARGEFKTAERLGNIADNQLRAADRLDLPTAKFGSEEFVLSDALREAEIGALDKDSVSDTIASLYSDEGETRLALSTSAAAIEKGWRQIHAEAMMHSNYGNEELEHENTADAHKEAAKDRPVEDLKRELMSDKDAYKLEQHMAKMNAAANQQAQLINNVLDKVDEAAGEHIEYDDDHDATGLPNAMSEHDLLPADRDQLIEAATNGDRLKPVKDLEKAKKKVRKEVDKYYD